MAKVHTDVEALYGIREAVVKLGEQMVAAQSNFQRSFGQLSDQITDHIRSIDSELDSMVQDFEPEGRTDSFCCQKCGGRIMLKILGDETHCREEGCDGIARRVFDDSRVYEYRRRRDELESKKEGLLNSRRQFDDYGEYVVSLLDVNGSIGESGSNFEHFVKTINHWLETLEDYNSVQMPSETISIEDVKKKMM